MNPKDKDDLTKYAVFFLILSAVLLLSVVALVLYIKFKTSYCG